MTEPGALDNGVAQSEWTATVVGHHRLRHDVAVIRLIGEFVPFRAGQSVQVRAPQHPEVRRRLSPALPPSLDGKLEFHVRTVPGGWVSGSLVADTKVGDEWRIDAPAGTFHVDPDGDEVVMIAGGTGLAPMRAQILELSRAPEPPRTYLFVGGHSPRDLYASDMLVLLAAELPWLTVIPVVDRLDDPNWADEWYEHARVDIDFPADDLLEGTLADVVGSHGAFDRHQVLVCGSPAMTRATVDRLIETGTPADRIQYEGV
ncbi:oxidoreductase [Nocardia farcinica]|uniref:FAD-binding oxidoreductase n=1 Tax=Nocardia farcinica TaxID=37329 RepID=UPI001892FEDB|nr:FAD-binding oxidoreductase [Nocardia farcinica]MBF6068918.1 oxidoreductase [Nocardia farcinica]MBF6140762.1 oxidoreductase [Nocardia farcinica]MBF6255002.1 oxidoreductase [Nocardia farcinica]MBF6265101.1 oxidoreductase [Nocardia farcinica]MBF6282961.1 oxidoreductase [Nocardia farcinica]